MIYDKGNFWWGYGFINFMLVLYLRLELSWVSFFVIIILGIVEKKKIYVREMIVVVICGVLGICCGIDKVGYVVLFFVFGFFVRFV